MQTMNEKSVLPCLLTPLKEMFQRESYGLAWNFHHKKPATKGSLNYKHSELMTKLYYFGIWQYLKLQAGIKYNTLVYAI